MGRWPCGRGKWVVKRGLKLANGIEETLKQLLQHCKAHRGLQRRFSATRPKEAPSKASFRDKVMGRSHSSQMKESVDLIASKLVTVELEGEEGHPQAAQPSGKRYARELATNHKPALFALLETHCPFTRV
ncbi:putative Transposon TX1 [Sesbania bispinosa]|nr:putative Transposon TX1 [Sesbania bispinosa]